MSDGWRNFNAAVDQARALVAAAATDPELAEEGEGYVTRLAAAGLATTVLGHQFRADGLARALPVHGGPNPDYIMRHAPVLPGRRYRLEGRLNGSERVGVGLYSVGGGGTLLSAGYTVFDRTNCPADGGFSLDIAADARAPDGLPLTPDARILLIRVLHRRPDQPASVSLLGGAPDRGQGLATGSNDEALNFAAHAIGNNVREYLKWSAAARELHNRLDVAPPELTAVVQGDPDTCYFLGGFDLTEGEWLEVTMPAEIGGYWSLHAYNYWHEHLQTPGVHDRNATPDPDGRIRIAVGPNLPESRRNRIDTVGRRQGALICRIIGHGGRPVTRLHKPDGA